MADSSLQTCRPFAPTTFFGSMDGLVLNVANGDLGDANTSYFYFNLVKAGFNAFVAQHTIQATTLAYEATSDGDDVDDSSALWVDITDFVSGGAVASYTSTGYANVGTPICWPRLRIKRLTTNATNALQIRLTRVKL